MTIELCSGVGKYHTDNPNADRPRPLKAISLKTIAEMAKSPQSVHKDNAQWIIPSTLLTRDKRSQIERGCFHALTLDIDGEPEEPPPTFDRLMEAILLTIGGGAALGYLSKKASEDCQKAHVIIPTVALNGQQWRLCQEVLINRLGEFSIKVDKALLNQGQIIYLPNRGEFYKYQLIKGSFFNPLAVWKSEIAELATHQAEIEQQNRREQMERQLSRPPSTMVRADSNIIRVFNGIYPIENILLQAGYDQKGSDFRHPNSQTGNYSASVRNGRVFTLSSSDPLYSNHAHDAFSAFTVLFHNGDMREALIDAGNNWLTADNGLTWNQMQQAKFITEGRV